MTMQAIKALLQETNQPHLLAGVEALCSEQQSAFLLQLQQYAPFLKEQRDLLSSAATALPDICPCTTFEYKGDPENRRLGEALLKQGKVGCLILAGGQGTRLGFDGPKGMVPVTPLKEKSLFQLLCERVKAASDWARAELPLAIMTSEENHEQTLSFFEKNQYFGLGKVSFFKQGQLPFIDNQGNWVLKGPGLLQIGPDGNGAALHLFFSSGLWQQWKDKGIEYVNLIFVDNALADPFDSEFIGYTAKGRLDVALKAVPRLAPQEAMGVVVQSGGHMRVIEYTELPSNLEVFTLSSTGMFCVGMPFIESLCRVSAGFPLHLARKTAEVWQPDLPSPCLEKRQIGKCERFIFDLLFYTSFSGAFVCPREQVYAPLKNAVGDKSLDTVKQALLHHDRTLYQTLTGMNLPSLGIEIDPAFYYASDALRPQLVHYDLGSILS